MRVMSLIYYLYLTGTDVHYDGAASSLFNESPLVVKLAAMDAGPVTGSNPSACLVARVIRLKKAHREGGLPNREF